MCDFLILKIKLNTFPYSKFSWSVFSRIRTEYGEIIRISSYKVQMQENTDQKTPNTDTFYAVEAEATFKKGF